MSFHQDTHIRRLDQLEPLNWFCLLIWEEDLNEKYMILGVNTLPRVLHADKKLSTLVDTGANISLIKLNAFSTKPTHLKSSLIHGQLLKIDDSIIPIVGTTFITLQPKDLTFNH